MMHWLSTVSLKFMMGKYVVGMEGLVLKTTVLLIIEPLSLSLSPSLSLPTLAYQRVQVTKFTIFKLQEWGHTLNS